MSSPATTASRPWSPVAGVERLTDITTSTWTVIVAIDPTTVLPAIARALAGHSADMLHLRTRHAGDQVWHDALNRLSQSAAIQAALTITMTPEQASSVATDLDWASTEIRCDVCNGIREYDHIPECAGCTGDDETPERDM
jgi:hypothetical protein